MDLGGYNFPKDITSLSPCNIHFLFLPSHVCLTFFLHNYFCLGVPISPTSLFSCCLQQHITSYFFVRFSPSWSTTKNSLKFSIHGSIIRITKLSEGSDPLNMNSWCCELGDGISGGGKWNSVVIIQRFCRSWLFQKEMVPVNHISVSSLRFIHWYISVIAQVMVCCDLCSDFLSRFDSEEKESGVIALFHLC